MEQCERRDRAPGAYKGLFFNTTTFERIPTSRVRQITRAAQVNTVRDPSLLTSNSWRRWFSTVAMLLGLTPEERLALSDWTSQELARLAMRAASFMPLRYAGLKAHKSKLAKLRIEEATYRLASAGTQGNIWPAPSTASAP